MLVPNPDIHFWNYNTKINFRANLGQKIKNSLFCLKIGAHNISRMLVPNIDLDFWNSDPKIQLWANLSPKIESCLRCLKNGSHSISRLLIGNSDSDFWNSNPKSIYGQIYAQKLKVVRLAGKLVHIVSQGCWFLIQTYIFEIPTPKSIFGQI